MVFASAEISIKTLWVVCQIYMVSYLYDYYFLIFLNTIVWISLSSFKKTKFEAIKIGSELDYLFTQPNHPHLQALCESKTEN